MYRTQPVAKRRLCSVYAAAGAIYHFRCYHNAVELRPQCGGFFAQVVVVRNRCDSGITLFAIQSATSNQ